MLLRLDFEFKDIMKNIRIVCFSISIITISGFYELKFDFRID